MIELLIDVLDEEKAQRAHILPKTTVAQLIGAIKREFDVSGDVDRYELIHKGSGVVLEHEHVIGQIAKQLNLREKDALLLRDKPKPTLREPISGKSRAVLIDTNTGEQFLLAWQPAIIGRRAGMSLPELLAVDLTYDINSRRISRMHAQITEKDGEWFIERLANENPTYLNGEAIRNNEKAKLNSNDVIQPGRKVLKLAIQITEDF